MKMKSFQLQDTVNRKKWQPTDQEKFAQTPYLTEANFQNTYKHQETKPQQIEKKCNLIMVYGRK